MVEGYLGKIGRIIGLRHDGCDSHEIVDLRAYYFVSNN